MRDFDKIHLAQDKEVLRAFMTMIMNLGVP